MNVNNNQVGKGGLSGLSQVEANQPVVPNGGNQGNVVQVEGESPIQTSSNEENPEVTLDQRNVHVANNNVNNDGQPKDEALGLLNEVQQFAQDDGEDFQIYCEYD